MDSLLAALCVTLPACAISYLATVDWFRPPAHERTDTP